MTELEKMHVLIAEIKRCIDNGQKDRAVGKLAYLDYMLSALPASASPHPETVKALLKRWEDRAEGFSEGAREASPYGIDEKPEHDRCMAAMNAIHGCINDLTKLPALSASLDEETPAQKEKS